MSFLGKVASPIPVDPLTTKVLEKAPKPIRTVLNPAGPILKKAVGEDRARYLLDPLQLGGTDNPDIEKQKTTLLGG
jgi:hypothetical protein